MVIAHEAPLTQGFAAEVSATIQVRIFNVYTITTVIISYIPL